MAGERLQRRLRGGSSGFGGVRGQSSSGPASGGLASPSQWLDRGGGGGGSTGIEPAGRDAEASRELAEGGGGVAASVAEHLAMVEPQAEGVGQQTDDGQDHQRPALMRGGLLQVAIGGGGLEQLGIDVPPAATQLVEEQRRDGSQIQVAGVIVGGGLFHRWFLFAPDNGLVFNDGPLAPASPHGFQNPNRPVGGGPAEFRQVPVMQLTASVGLASVREPRVMRSRLRPGRLDCP